MNHVDCEKVLRTFGWTVVQRRVTQNIKSPIRQIDYYH